MSNSGRLLVLCWDCTLGFDTCIHFLQISNTEAYLFFSAVLFILAFLPVSTFICLTLLSAVLF